MSTVNANIPLQAGANLPVLTPMDIMSMHAMQQQAQLRQAQIANLPQEQAQQRLQQQATLADLQAQTEQRRAAAYANMERIGQDKVSTLRDVASAQVSLFDSSTKAGAAPQQAREQAIALGNERIDELEKSGRFNPEAIAQMRAKNAQWDPQRSRANLMTADEWLKEQSAAAKPVTPESPVGKAEADFKAGRITKAERDAQIAKETHITQGEEGKPLTDIAKLNADYKAGRITKQQFEDESKKKTGSKEGLTVADKMNPVMLATVKLDVTEGRKALDFMREAGLDEGSPFYADEHGAGAISRLWKKTVTPENQQEFDVYANRLGQAIASAQSMGRGQISQEKIREAQKNIPVMGDAKRIRDVKMDQLGLFFDYVDEVLKTPLKSGARTEEDEQRDVNDFSHLWK